MADVAAHGVDPALEISAPGGHVADGEEGPARGSGHRPGAGLRRRLGPEALTAR